MTNEAMYKTVKISAIAILLAVLTWSFYLTGNPYTKRQLRIDKLHIQDIYTTARVVHLYYIKEKELPISLDVILKKKMVGPKSHHEDKNAVRHFRKAENRESFDVKYKPKGGSSYSLCTEFSHDWNTRYDWNSKYNYKNHSKYFYKNPWEGTGWKHPAGQHCFDFIVQEKRKNKRLEIWPDQT